jgi:hypothetical protein
MVRTSESVFFKLEIKASDSCEKTGKKYKILCIIFLRK